MKKIARIFLLAMTLCLLSCSSVYAADWSIEINGVKSNVQVQEIDGVPYASVAALGEAVGGKVNEVYYNKFWDTRTITVSFDNECYSFFHVGTNCCSCRVGSADPFNFSMNGYVKIIDNQVYAPIQWVNGMKWPVKLDNNCLKIDTTTKLEKYNWVSYGGKKPDYDNMPVVNKLGQQIKATLPTFKVTMNGQLVDNTYREYPFIVYKDITYFPMTHWDAKFLGLGKYWYQDYGTMITNQLTTSQYVPSTIDVANNKTVSAIVSSGKYTVYGVEVDNTKEQYPIISYKNVAYFPLTWTWCQTFGWKSSFDMENGLIINTSGNKKQKDEWVMPKEEAQNTIAPSNAATNPNSNISQPTNQQTSQVTNLSDYIKHLYLVYVDKTASYKVRKPLDGYILPYQTSNGKQYVLCTLYYQVETEYRVLKDYAYCVVDDKGEIILNPEAQYRQITKSYNSIAERDEAFARLSDLYAAQEETMNALLDITLHKNNTGKGLYVEGSQIKR